MSKSNNNRGGRIVRASLGDPFYVNQALKINDALREIGAEVYQVCSKIKDKANSSYYRLSWRRLGNQCFTGDDKVKYPSASYISEKKVREMLRKKYKITLDAIINNTNEAIKKAKEVVDEILEKSKEKVKKVVTPKENSKEKVKKVVTPKEKSKEKVKTKRVKVQEVEEDKNMKTKKISEQEEISKTEMVIEEPETTKIITPNYDDSSDKEKAIDKALEQTNQLLAFLKQKIN